MGANEPDGPTIARELSTVVAEAGLETVEPESAPEPTLDGTLAFRVDDGRREAAPLAEVYVQPDRARVEVLTAPAVAAEVASETGLRVRPKAVRPPRTLVFVEHAAAVESAVGVLGAVASYECGE